MSEEREHRIDLHTHSTASDGALAPAELVAQAARSGIGILSLTDHDTVAGLEEAEIAAGRLGLGLVPGIEVTAWAEGREVHVLGYFLDRNHSGLASFLGVQRRDRMIRTFKILERLKEAGIQLEPQDVVPDPEKVGTVGRLHIAQALLRKKLVRSIPDAFEKYLGAKSPSYVPRSWSEAVEVFRIIRAAGGIPIMAHPGKGDRDLMIARLADAGLAGIEVFHPDHDERWTLHYRQLARELDILATGGSDFHGHQSVRHGGIGHPCCDPADFEKLRQAAGR